MRAREERFGEEQVPRFEAARWRAWHGEDAVAAGGQTCVCACPPAAPSGTRPRTG